MEREIWGFNLEHLKKVMKSRSLERIELKPGQIILTKRVIFTNYKREKFYVFDLMKVLEVSDNKGTRVQEANNIFNFFQGKFLFTPPFEGILKEYVFSTDAYTLECEKAYSLHFSSGILGGNHPLAGIWLLAEE